MEEWLNSKGEIILRELGITNRQHILDFGCGTGVYSIIASRVVGNTGKIYALDYDENVLKELTDKIKNQNINNIEIIKSSKEISVPLKSNSIDVVLMYDVFHLLDKDDRVKLLNEIYRILKKKLWYSFLFCYSYRILWNPIKKSPRSNTKDWL